MSFLLDLLTWLCLGAGAFLGVLGGVGMHRFPDFYTRLHAAGTTDTLCAALFLFGLGLQSGVSLVSFKLFLIFAFLYFTSPTACHILADAAGHGGLEPQLDHDPKGRGQ